MKITTEISVDLVRRGILPVVQAVQNDKNTRYLDLILTANNQAWTPPDGTTAIVRYCKSDGRGGEYDLLPDGTPAYSFEKNVVTVALAPQVLTTAGPVRLNVGLINGEAEISTFRIQINVEPNVGAELVDSEDYYNTSWVKEDIAQLKTAVANLQYDIIGPIDITSVSNSVGTAEMGATVKAVTITWALNRDPVSQTVDGTAVDPAARSVTLEGLAVTAGKSFTVKATDERDVMDTATTKINFYNGVYSGVLEDGAALDSAAILSLTRKLQSGKALTFTVNAGATQRIAYALPTRYGTPNFNVGGFDGGFYLAATINFKNGSGYTEPYNVWLSDNTGLGSTTVKVT